MRKQSKRNIVPYDQAEHTGRWIITDDMGNGFAISILMIVTCCFVVIPVGHGATSIGLLLLIGDADEFRWPRAVTAIAALSVVVSALIPRERWREVLGYCGTTGMVLAWGIWMSVSDGVSAGLCFSVPFLVTVGIKYYHIKKTRSIRGRR